MPYRICTFDSDGKILSVSPESYPNTSVITNPSLYFMPGAMSLVDEDLLPSTIINSDTQPEVDISSNGYEASFSFPTNSIYDPRVEVTLFMANPYPYLVRNSKVKQDVTKAVAVYNLSDSTTIPKHSSTQFKTEGGSCKFTRSLTGYTGGSIYLTNLSKRTYGGSTAPHNDIGVGLTASWAFEMYFYPISNANNFTLLQKGPTGGSANWKLSFDSSAGQLQFAWQQYNTTAGYNFTQNIVNSAGMTLNSWHHVAVSLVKNGAGVCYQMSGYFNGSSVFTQGVTLSSTTEVRGGHGLHIGNNSAGTESFDGFIDMFRMLESFGTGGIFGTAGYGFLPFGGGTLGVPTLSGFVLNDETAFAMNFNGESDTSEFYAESTDFITGTARRFTNLTLGISGISPLTSSEVGVADVVRYTVGFTAGSTGLSDPTGFSTNYGAIVAAFAPPGGTGYTGQHGIDHCFALNGVYDNAPSLDVLRTNYQNEALQQYGLMGLVMIEGASGNRGSSGSPLASRFGTNPFRRLFSGGAGNCYGGANAYTALFVDPTDQYVMSYIMDNGFLVTQGISLASYSFRDGKGITRTISPQEISNLRLDILEFQSKNKEKIDTLIVDVSTASTKNELKNFKFNKFIAETIGVPEVVGPFKG